MKSRDQSPCPIARTLDLVGDRWSMLILRDMFAGRSFYREFLASPERIATNILSARLKSLEHHGLIRKDKEKGRGAYALTAKGRDTEPMLQAVADFGLKHIEGTEAKIVPPSP